MRRSNNFQWWSANRDNIYKVVWESQKVENRWFTVKELILPRGRSLLNRKPSTSIHLGRLMQTKQANPIQSKYIDTRRLWVYLYPRVCLYQLVRHSHHVNGISGSPVCVWSFGVTTSWLHIIGNLAPSKTYYYFRLIVG